MKKLLIILVIAIAAIASYTANSNAEKIDYNSAKLERFADGIKYDSETNTIYTSGKVARWTVQRAERAYRESGDREFWMDNNLPETSKNYKCVKVDKIVYGK
jgi:uncharacterized protein YxeA